MMGDRRALVVRRSFEYEDVDVFRRCRSLYQKIGFVLDKWEESVGDLCPRVSRQELSCAENCLDETEKKLWKLVARQMTAGSMGVGPGQSTASSDQNQRPFNKQLECIQKEVLTTRHSPSANSQMVRVQRRVQTQNVALQQADAVQTKLLPINSNQQLVNLLVDWYLTLGDNGVHLEGMLLNEGHWKTSPIAVRVGPTTVKTASGTTYNISGDLCLPEDENIPEFIYNKFKHGFPSDWQEAVREWMGLVDAQRRLAVPPNVDVMQKKDPPRIQNPIKLQEKATDNKVQETDFDIDQDKMPPPGRTASTLRKIMVKESAMLSRTHSALEIGRHENKAKGEQNKLITPGGRRASNRVLMKSLSDLSMNNSALTSSQDMSVDVNALKKWGAEFVQETGELVLVGNLVSDNQHVIDRNFISSGVLRRIQADLVETADGEIYRLIGPANSSEMKLFLHGFPLRWKDHIKKKQFPVKTATANAKASRKQDTSADKASSSSQKMARNSPRSSNSHNSAADKNNPISSAHQQKRTSQVIQQIVRHSIKQSQNSTFGSKSNHSLMGKANDSQLNKRKNRSLLPSQGTNPLKKMRAEDMKSHGEGGVLRSQHSISEADVSSTSENNVKQCRVRDSNAGKDKKAEGEMSKMQSQQGKTGTVKKSAIRSELNTTGKYLAGLMSNGGSGEFDFNIF